MLILHLERQMASESPPLEPGSGISEATTLAHSKIQETIARLTAYRDGAAAIGADARDVEALDCQIANAE